MNIKTKINNLSVSLRDTDYLMVDTLDELEFCKKIGLNSKTKIISFNPFVVLNKKIKVESPEKYLDYEYYINLAEIRCYK